MFGFFAKKITENSGHMVDASRIGNLLRSKEHQYTREQLLTRGFIISFSAISGFMGWCLNNENKTNYSNSSIAIAMTLAGFVLSHTVVIIPLIQKRCRIKNDCNKLAADIIVMDNSEETRQKVEEIMALSLSDNEHARASQTWGRRKNLLIELKNQLITPTRPVIGKKLM